jgi:hypothetical protein
VRCSGDGNSRFQEVGDVSAQDGGPGVTNMSWGSMILKCTRAFGKSFKEIFSSRRTKTIAVTEI